MDALGSKRQKSFFISNSLHASLNPRGLNMEESQACGHMRVVSEHVTTGVKD
ncbi:unnamed protein product [Sphenostylis stenocarpa]|uniref:Uncharacterized protein n=1 Tax=Sphenostylis stenocarpa TaxID=92480 RepID=A0AA87B9M5_9FABA|nr:unnamed protein product [Sphenostylis stenocarpa]